MGQTPGFEANVQFSPLLHHMVLRDHWAVMAVSSPVVYGETTVKSSLLEKVFVVQDVGKRRVNNRCRRGKQKLVRDQKLRPGISRQPCG
jgi:hypothetical protein